MSKSKLQELKDFLNAPPGSKWYKVNLHVHASGQAPVEIVDAAIRAGINLIAITDHNTFRFVKPVQEAAAKRADADLVVLPGIEITLEEGAHIIAIFDSDFDEKAQTHFLGTLKLPIDATAMNAVKDRTCSQVLTDITDVKGITVVPHPYIKNIGFLDSARKVPTKLDWLESGNIGLIQIDDDKVKYVDFDGDGKWQNRYVLSSSSSSVVSATDYCLAPISPSEAKTPEDIENGGVWLKLGSRTVRGLRQVTCEPRTCISRDDPSQKKPFALLGLTVEGGFFDGLNIGFSPDLTCIIGENHSGKTAIFDFISFALGRDQSTLALPDRAEERDLLLRRLHAILQSNGRVNLYLTRNGRTFCVSRVFIPDFDKKTTEIIDIQTEPKALEYDSENNQLMPMDMREIPVLPEISTQGHVGVLRKSVISQLALIDDLAGLAGERKERNNLKELLEANADDLADLEEKREGLAGTVGGLTRLKKDLRDKEKHLDETDNKKWQASATKINNVKDRIDALDKSLDDKKKAQFGKEWKVGTLEFDETRVAHPELLKNISGAVNIYNAEVDSISLKLEQAVEAVKNTCQPIFDNWNGKLYKHNELVAQVLRQKGYDSPEQLLNELAGLQKQITKIEKEDAPQLVEIEKELATLTATRDGLLQKLGKIFKTITDSREAKIEELNKTVGPDVTISLEQPDPKAYMEILKEVCGEIAAKDRKIHKRDEQLALVVYTVQPSELVEAILNGGVFTKKDGTKVSLVDAALITPNTQDVLCSIKNQARSLHKLQVFEREPVPKISVRREGTGTFADLRTELSPGEQSSTILALALMAREEPLIIDQPEDELGYSYIVNKIVPKILDSKIERQVILISHNANIPVLADAEFIMKVRNDPVASQAKCSIEEAGTFAEESVCAKLLELEGGERAFQVRQYRYAIPRRAGIY